MKTFLTADLHFGCENLRKHTRAEYETIEDHNSAIICNTNRAVSRGDRLVILGDFCFKNVARYRNQLRCRHILFILGNHDKRGRTMEAFGQGQVCDSRMLKLNRGLVWCSHYPHCYWPQSHYGSYHAYGHLHYNADHEWDMDCGFPGRRSMDVGVDSAKLILGEHRPFSEDEFFDLLADRTGHGLIEKRK